MSKVKVVLNRAGVRELLRSKEMMAICKEHADAAVSRLGPGYESDTYTGTNRVNASVAAVSQKAKRQNMKENTILKALK